uniref:tRNA-binding domain-containing protein n=1 Tax=Tetraselmis chuii TaxID=63592 RepID=A0A7S1SWL4_9CHLO
MATAIDEAIRLVDALLVEIKSGGSSDRKARNDAGASTVNPAGKDGKKEKKPKQEKKAAPAAAAAQPSGEDDLFSSANIQVGRCASVTDHPNSDKLIKIEVDIGNGEVKKVCAGLKQYIAKEELQGSLVCVIVNLKAAKLGGEPSEAMILAADAQSPSSPNEEIVKPLVPPAGSKPGDQVFLEGGVPSTNLPKTLKSDKWKKIVPELSVRGGKACYRGKPMVVASGAVTLPEVIPDGSGIH